MATYTDIVARLKAFLEDDYTEFAASIPTMIENAEQAISRELEVDAMIERANGTMTSGNQLLTRASAIVSVNYFYITVSNKRRPLFFRKTSYLDSYWPNPTKKDVPRFYGNHDEVNWQITPTPKANYPYVAETLQRIAGLSESTPTTWISLNYPDLLFYACCLQGGVFDMDTDDTNRFQPLYDRALETAIAEVDRVRSDLNTMHARDR